MEHSMRRTERALSQDEAIQILEEAEYGILSTCGSDGEPYGVPISFVYTDSGIVFHCASAIGHKLSHIKENPQVCFTVIKPGSVETLPEKFSTYYSSTIVFGTVRKLEGEDKRNALRLLVTKYSPAYQDKGEVYIKQADEKVTAYKIKIKRLTGKGHRC